MASLWELERRLESYPKGYLSYKTIHGKKVAYLQYRAKEGIHSTYIREKDLPIIIALIGERKRLEEEIKERKKKEQAALAKISPMARKLTGSLLSGNRVVAAFEEGVLVWMDEGRAPLWIKRNHDLADWLSHRAIDSHRPHSRLLKKMVRLKESDDAMVSLSAHGATLTDDYWFRPKHSKLKYENIRFQDDSYFHLALSGDSSHLKKKALLSPEFTNIGSFEKAWKKKEDGWWMYKKESPMELFSELFAAMLGEKMGFSMAHYEKEGEFIKTRNFAEEWNFEPAMGLLGEEEDYALCYRRFHEIDPAIAFDYLKLIWFDSLVYNVDRHNENYGLLRERRSGKILGLAPNFDNNLALFSRGYPKDKRRKSDAFISFFAELLEKEENAQRQYREWQIPPLDEKTIASLAEKIAMPIDLPFLIEYLLSGYRLLKELQKP